MQEKRTSLPMCDDAHTFDPLIGIVNKQKLGWRKVTGLAVKVKKSPKLRSSRQLQRTEEVAEKNNRRRNNAGREIPELALGKADCWD